MRPPRVRSSGVRAAPSTPPVRLSPVPRATIGRPLGTSGEPGVVVAQVGSRPGRSPRPTARPPDPLTTLLLALDHVILPRRLRPQEPLYEVIPFPLDHVGRHAVPYIGHDEHVEILLCLDQRIHQSESH